VRPVAATLALVLVAAAFPQFAAAQDDGVFFDPGGPSDKEYAMPHAQARGGGGDKGSSDKGGAPAPGQSGGGGPSSGSGGGQATPQQGSSDAQLFGQGITRAQSDRKRERASAGTPDAATGQAASGGGDNVVGLAPASADTDTAMGLGWFLAIAAAVALLGGGLAYITRSRTRGPAT